MSIEFSSFENALAQNNQNKGVFARFYDKLIKTGEINAKGLPVFEKKLYVEIKIRDQYDVFDQPACEDHIKRFEPQYLHYLKEQKQKKQGTPLSMFAFLSPEQIECCYFRDIYNLEDLSKLDSKKARDLNLETEKELAEQFLKVSKNNQALFQMQKKQKEYLQQIEELKTEITRLKKYEPKS